MGGGDPSDFSLSKSRLVKREVKFSWCLPIKVLQTLGGRSWEKVKLMVHLEAQAGGELWGVTPEWGPLGNWAFKLPYPAGIGQGQLCPGKTHFQAFPAFFHKVALVTQRQASGGLTLL